MKKHFVFLVVLMLLHMVGCANTEFKSFEGVDNVIEGKGGTKVVVDGMEIWDYGEPPRKFKVVGIIDDERPGGPLSMASLLSNMVEKARTAGGDAIIQLGSQSQITGYNTTQSTTEYGSSVSIPIRRNAAKFAVIKYVE